MNLIAKCKVNNLVPRPPPRLYLAAVEKSQLSPRLQDKVWVEAWVRGYKVNGRVEIYGCHNLGVAEIINIQFKNETTGRDGIPKKKPYKVATTTSCVYDNTKTVNRCHSKVDYCLLAMILSAPFLVSSLKQLHGGKISSAMGSCTPTFDQSKAESTA